MQALPGTQGIYGLIIAFLIMVKIGLLSGSMIELSASQGFYFLCAGIPIGAVGIWSGIAQGKAAAAALQLTAKRPDQMVKGYHLYRDGRNLRDLRAAGFRTDLAENTGIKRHSEYRNAGIPMERQRII